MEIRMSPRKIIKKTLTRRTRIELGVGHWRDVGETCDRVSETKMGTMLKENTYPSLFY